MTTSGTQAYLPFVFRMYRGLTYRWFQFHGLIISSGVIGITAVEAVYPYNTSTMPERVSGYRETRISIRERGGCLPAVGCLGSVALLTIFLAAFGVGIGGGFSVRPPTSDVRIVWGGAIGNKDVIPRVTPWYVRQQLGKDSNFLNHSANFNIGVAEVNEAGVIDKNLQVPDAALDINAATR